MDETDPDTGLESDTGEGHVDAPGAPDDEDASADTFGVGIHVTERELQFVVHVPSAIDSGWSDPEAFQQLVERVVWTRLDQESTLRAIASSAETGDTVTLGTVTLRPDGTVVDDSLSAPTASSGSGANPADAGRTTTDTTDEQARTDERDENRVGGQNREADHDDA